jgi:hypothetical protein
MLSQKVKLWILLLGFQLQRSNDGAETFVVALEHRGTCVAVQANAVARNLSGNCRSEPFGCERMESLTRLRTADWRPRWRRSGTADARSGTVRRAAMNESVASHIFHLRRRNNRSSSGALRKMASHGQLVEMSAKIAMRALSGSLPAVDLLLRLSRRRSKSSPPFRAYRPVIPLSTASVCAFT